MPEQEKDERKKEKQMLMSSEVWDKAQKWVARLSWSSISRSPVDLPHGFFFFQSIDSSRFPSKRRKWRLLFEGTPRFV
jgi:hypothetical protein